MAIDLVAADKYFTETVLHNEVWLNADSDSKKRALNNASFMISRQYPNREIPSEAIYEQALWLMKISEVRKYSEQGVTSYSIDGISVSLSQVDRSIAPTVIQLLGRKFGRSESGRSGYIVSSDKRIRPPSGGTR